MRFIRRHASPLFAVWMTFQVAALAAPVMLVAGDELGLCSCPGTAPDASCPMHSHQAGENGKPPCSMRGPHAAQDAALLSLAGGAGILPDSASATTAQAVMPLQRRSARNWISRAESPDFPPPRV